MNISVSEIMTTKVCTITRKDTLKHAEDIFKNSTFRHLLVADEQNILQGIVSDRDVFRMTSPYLHTEHQTEKDITWMDTAVEQFMTTRFIQVDRDTLIDSASILLLENKISCLPVLDDNQHIDGIVTWKDLLKYYVYQ